MPKKKAYPKGKAAKRKEKKVFEEFKEKKLHSGSKKGPLVTSHAQAVAIALEEGRKAGKLKKKK